MIDRIGGNCKLGLQPRQRLQIPREANRDQADHPRQGNDQDDVRDLRHGDRGEHGVAGDQHQAHFGRSNAAIAEAESTEHRRLEVDVDRQDEICED
jgi:hypothetical protein